MTFLKQLLAEAPESSKLESKLKLNGIKTESGERKRKAAAEPTASIQVWRFVFMQSESNQLHSSFEINISKQIDLYHSYLILYKMNFVKFIEDR